MDNTPKQPTVNSVANGRGPRGRFGPSNKFGRGNPGCRKMKELRERLLKKAKSKDFDAVLKRLTHEAENGQSWAIKLYLEYHVGPPLAIDVAERLQTLENLIEQRNQR